jgi:hypothetical protein
VLDVVDKHVSEAEPRTAPNSWGYFWVTLRTKRGLAASFILKSQYLFRFRAEAHTPQRKPFVGYRSAGAHPRQLQTLRRQRAQLCDETTAACTHKNLQRYLKHALQSDSFTRARKRCP